MLRWTIRQFRWRRLHSHCPAPSEPDDTTQPSVPSPGLLTEVAITDMPSNSGLPSATEALAESQTGSTALATLVPQSDTDWVTGDAQRAAWRPCSSTYADSVQQAGLHPLGSLP